MEYRRVYEGWKDDPERFWMEAAKAIGRFDGALQSQAFLNCISMETGVV